MRSRLLGVLYAAIAGAAALAFVAEIAAAGGNVDRLAQGVDSLFAEWNHTDTPGAAVVLTDNGRVVLERCYGIADLEHGVPITPATRFELASVSKNFTAFGVLLLAQEGRLSLDDDIRRTLPELPDNGSVTTIRHLVNQTSGLSECLKLLPYMGVLDLDRLYMQDIISMLAHQSAPDFPPGSRWAYSNTNYILLAEIVSRVTGRPFGGWMAESVFQPLGMLETSFPVDGHEILPNRANSYSIRGGRLARLPYDLPGVPGSAHAYSTIRDMAKWMDNFRTCKLGGPEVVSTMQRKGVLTSGEESWYAAGLGIGLYRGVRTAGHAGSFGGFKSEMILCPDLGVGVTVLANFGRMRTEQLARSILDLYLGDRLEPAETPEPPETLDPAGPKPFIEAEPAAIDRFLGAYRLEADPSMLVFIAREGGQLAGILSGVGMDFFLPTAATEFENRLRNTQITFIDAADGRPARARIVLKGDEMWAARIPQEQDRRPAADFAGAYYSDEWGTVYEILPEGKDFIVRHRRMGDRPLQRMDADRLAGGMGLLTFARDAGGLVTGFVFEEPEDLPGRKVEFRKMEH